MRVLSEPWDQSMIVPRVSRGLMKAFGSVCVLKSSRADDGVGKIFLRAASATTWKTAVHSAGPSDV